MIAPCMSCTARTVDCHINCDEYKQFRKKLDEAKRAQAANKQADEYISETALSNKSNAIGFMAGWQKQ